MFKYVHHVHYVVRNLDEMVAYIEKNFGMTPEKQVYYEEQGMKDAHYRMGRTRVQITEPLKPQARIYQFLEQHGPGAFFA